MPSSSIENRIGALTPTTSKRATSQRARLAGEPRPSGKRCAPSSLLPPSGEVPARPPGKRPPSARTRAPSGPLLHAQTRAARGASRRAAGVKDTKDAVSPVFSPWGIGHRFVLFRLPQVFEARAAYC